MKHSTIREIMRLEKIGESTPPSEVSLDVSNEFSICEGKLEKMISNGLIRVYLS